MPKQQAILVVDDEPDILELLVHLLSKEGYRVLKASDGRSALEIMSESAIDLVLTDLMMPAMDGAQLAAQMRARPQCKAIPLMMISALPEATVRGIYDQYDSFLQKPFHGGTLLALVRGLLS
jgi:DNA-binding response OmpR family regulator